jgi:hypothetical protein
MARPISPSSNGQFMKTLVSGDRFAGARRLLFLLVTNSLPSLAEAE